MNPKAESQIPVPTNVKEITPEWTSRILGCKISEKDFHIQTDVQNGSGYLSKMSRLECKSESNGKSYSLIIKLLPEDEIMRALVVSEEFDKTEIQFYCIVMPRLIEIVPELEEYLCHSYYGKVQAQDDEKGLEYSSVLVMEDLKPLGYYTINFAGQETLEQMREVVQFLAKFHFAGMVLEENEGKPLPEVYDFLQGAEDDKESMFYGMAKVGFIDIVNLAKEHGASQNLIDAFNKLAPHSDEIIEKVQEAGLSFACLIHGDLWPNNLLYNENPKMHTKVIDWQLLGYKDPAFDLAVTIISCLSMDQYESKDGMTSELLQLYYETFTAQCELAGKNHFIKRDFETFKTFFFTWGTSYMLLWCLMASDPFAASYPKLFKIYEFLTKEANVHEFLLKQCELSG
jgi:hypothetical protein